MAGAFVNVTDPGDPRLAPYAGLRERQLVPRPGDEGMLIAEGELVVRQLAGSPYRVLSVLITPTRLLAMRDVIDALPREVSVLIGSDELVRTVAGFPIHRGVLACAARLAPDHPFCRLPEAIQRARCAVVLEDLTNHDNIGGMFRALAALCGRHAVMLLSPRCADPLYRKAVRVSMGQALCVPFARLTPWPDAFGLLREAGFDIVALTPQTDASDIASFNFPTGRKPALLLGSEGPGLSEAALAAADHRVRIAIDPEVDSLNVTVAGAIGLHRLCRPSI